MGGLRGVKDGRGFIPHKRTTPKIFYRAKELRHEQTPAEGRLWAYLRAHRADGAGFRRQHAIGPYIVDFYAPRQKLIIEVDGSQHLEQQKYDAEHMAFLEALGCRVLRFFNGDVMNKMEKVMGKFLSSCIRKSNRRLPSALRTQKSHFVTTEYSRASWPD